MNLRGIKKLATPPLALVIAALSPTPAFAVSFTVQADVPAIRGDDARSHTLAISWTGSTDQRVLDDPDWGSFYDFTDIRFDLDGGASGGGRTDTLASMRMLIGDHEFYRADEPDYYQPFMAALYASAAFFSQPGEFNADGVKFGTVTANLAYASLPWYSLGGENNAVYLGEWAVAPLSASPAPEPATWLFMLAGFGAVGTLLRANRRGKPAFGNI